MATCRIDKWNNTYIALREADVIQDPQRDFACRAPIPQVTLPRVVCQEYSVSDHVAISPPDPLSNRWMRLGDPPSRSTVQGRAVEGQDRAHLSQLR